MDSILPVGLKSSDAEAANQALTQGLLQSVSTVVVQNAMVGQSFWTLRMFAWFQEKFYSMLLLFGIHSTNSVLSVVESAVRPTGCSCGTGSKASIGPKLKCLDCKDEPESPKSEPEFEFEPGPSLEISTNDFAVEPYSEPCETIPLWKKFFQFPLSHEMKVQLDKMRSAPTLDQASDILQRNNTGLPEDEMNVAIVLAHLRETDPGLWHRLAASCTQKGQWRCATAFFGIMECLAAIDDPLDILTNIFANEHCVGGITVLIVLFECIEQVDPELAQQVQRTFTTDSKMAKLLQLRSEGDARKILNTLYRPEEGSRLTANSTTTIADTDTVAILAALGPKKVIEVFGAMEEKHSGLLDVFVWRYRTKAYPYLAAIALERGGEIISWMSTFALPELLDMLHTGGQRDAALWLLTFLNAQDVRRFLDHMLDCDGANWLWKAWNHEMTGPIGQQLPASIAAMPSWFSHSSDRPRKSILPLM
jgi:hypothetical protein